MKVQEIKYRVRTNTRAWAMRTSLTYIRNPTPSSLCLSVWLSVLSAWLFLSSSLFCVSNVFPCFSARVLSLTYVTPSAAAREGNAKPAAYTTANTSALGPGILKQDKRIQWPT